MKCLEALWLFLKDMARRTGDGDGKAVAYNYFGRFSFLPFFS
jgi:hypothetical protein